MICQTVPDSFVFLVLFGHNINVSILCLCNYNVAPCMGSLALFLFSLNIIIIVKSA